MRTIFTAAAFFTVTALLNAAGLIPELTTLDGKTYKQVKVMKVLPVEIRIMHADGFATVPLSALPPEIRSQYGTADVNAEMQYAAQKQQANVAAAAHARQEKEAIQIAELSHQPLAQCLQAVQMRDWCLANPQGGVAQDGTNFSTAARNDQLAQAMQTLNARPVEVMPTPPPAVPGAGGVPGVVGVPVAGGMAFTPGVIQLISARYTLQNDQPRNVKNHLAKLIPKGLITAPVTIQVTDALSTAAQDEGNITRGRAAGVSASQDGITVGVTDIVIQSPTANLLTVEYMFNGQRLRKEAQEGSYLVLP